MKQLKNILLLSFALFLMVGCSSAPQEKTVAIDEVNFPDEILRATVLKYDTSGDGLLQETEIVAAEELVIDFNVVLDFKGIELLTGLKSIKISSSSMTEFDATVYPNLESLCLKFVPIDEIDLSKNTKLKELDLSFTDIEKVDLSALTELEYVGLSLTNVSEVDFSHNSKLVEIQMSFSSTIKSIDVTHNPELKYLDITGATKIDTLDISNNPKLEYLSIAYTDINTLDASTMSKESEENTILLFGSRLISMVDAPNSVWTDDLFVSAALRPYKELSTVTLFEENNIDPDLIFDLEGATIDLEEGYIQVDSDNTTGYVTYKYYVNEAKDKYIECKIQLDPSLSI